MRLKLRISKTDAVVEPVESKTEGEWWEAVSTRLTTAQIARAFREEKVGGILYDTVMGVVPSDEFFWDRPVIFIRLKMPASRMEREGMELCLSELGIGLLEPVNPDQENSNGG